MNTPLAIKSNSLLRHTLRANGVFSGLSGLLFTLAAASITRFIGLPWPAVLIVVGLSLIGYAASLFIASNRAEVDRRAVAVFIALDVAWVVGSGLLLVTAWVPFTAAGKWAIVIIADVVALFALVQVYGLRRMGRSEA